MVHTVHDYLVFVRQGMPKVEPLRLLNLAEGEVEVQLYSLTDAALARMALDNLDEVPEDANTIAVMEDAGAPGPGGLRAAPGLRSSGARRGRLAGDSCAIPPSIA